MIPPTLFIFPWDVKVPDYVCCSFPLCPSIFALQFRCSYVRCINVYWGCILLSDYPLYHYSVFLCLLLGFKVHFVRYTCCYPSFLLFSICMKYLFPSLYFYSVCFFQSENSLLEAAYTWALFSYPFSYSISFGLSI